MAKEFDVSNFPPEVTGVMRLYDFDSSRQPHIETIHALLKEKALEVGVFLDRQYVEDSPERLIQEGLFEIGRLKPHFLEAAGSDQREKIGEYLLTRIAHTEERILALKAMKELEG
jgi:hypothetical protein